MILVVLVGTGLLVVGGILVEVGFGAGGVVVVFLGGGGGGGAAALVPYSHSPWRTPSPPHTANRPSVKSILLKPHFSH